MQTRIKLGKYRHYKGKSDQFYEVIGVGIHSETLEELVVYRALYSSSEFGDDVLWVRPVAMFLGYVNVGGAQVPRFEYVGDR